MQTKLTKCQGTQHIHDILVEEKKKEVPIELKILNI